MKVSIIGSNGFLSNAIGKYANKKNWELDVYGLTEPKNHRYNRFVKVDMMNADVDCSLLLSSDVIFYAVGAGIQSNLNDSNSKIYHLNVNVPVSICNRLQESGFKGCFVSFGSVFEIGETLEERSFSEKDIIFADASAPSDYVVSKRMLTTYVSSYKHDFTHWHFILPTIYGEGENPKRLIPYTIYSLLEGKEMKFTSGNQTRQYLYVGEVPRAIDLAISHHLESGLYNIEGKETLTVKDIVRLIHAYFCKEMQEGYFGTAERTDVAMKYLSLNGSQLYKATGFKAEISILDVISKYLSYGSNR